MVVAVVEEEDQVDEGPERYNGELVDRVSFVVCQTKRRKSTKISQINMPSGKA